MKKSVAALVMTLSPFLLFAENSNKIRADLQKLYDQYAVAVKAKNLQQAMSFSSADRTYTTQDGRVLKRWQIQRALETQFKATKKLAEVHYQVQSAVQKGTNVSTQVVAGMMGTSYDPVRKKSMTYRTFLLLQDTWVKSRGAWKLKSTKVLNDRTTYDGQQAIATSVKPLTVKPKIKRP